MAHDFTGEHPVPDALSPVFEGESPLQLTPNFGSSRLPEFPQPPEYNAEVERKLQEKRDEILAMDSDSLKSHQLPLARVKKIMKSDEEVRMISAEVPALFAQACELFIIEMSLRAWKSTVESNRKTLQRSDVSAAVAHTDMFDFLIDIVPREQS
jgi:nuclear transcription factor Y gamma